MAALNLGEGWVSGVIIVLLVIGEFHAGNLIAN